MTTEKPKFEGMQHTTQGFIDEFWRVYASRNVSMVRAYEIAEETHVELFGCHRFSSYDSFRQILKRKR